MSYQYLLFPLLFFPSITFGLLPAEIFPWSIFVSLFFIKYLQKDYVLLVAIFIPFCCLALVNGTSPSEILRSLFALFNASIAFFLIMRIDQRNINILLKILSYSLIVFILIGITQFFFSEINLILKYLVPRLSIYETDMLLLQGKGVPALATEPSRNAYEIIILLTLFHVINKSKLQNRLIIDFVILIYIIYINKSAMGIGFFIVYLITYFQLIKNIKFIKFFIFLFISSIVVSLISFEIIETRGTNLLFNISNSLTFERLQQLILVDAGFRFPSVFSSYLNFSYFGYGVGNWADGMVEGLEKFPYLYNSTNPNNYFLWACGGSPCPLPVRASSYFASIVLEIGIIGAFLIILLMVNCLKEMKMTEGDLEKRNVSILNFVPIIFSLLFIGDAGNPIPFVCLAILIKIYYNRI